MEPLIIRVGGLPAPQGSKRHVGNGVMVESSKRVKPWRAAVEKAARQAVAEREDIPQPLDAALIVTTTYFLPRPKSHYRTGRHASEKRDDAPVFVTTVPDVEKLVRSTHDALTRAGVWVDDSRVVVSIAEKRYAHRDHVGAVITVEPA